MSLNEDGDERVTGSLQERKCVTMLGIVSNQSLALEIVFFTIFATEKHIRMT